MNYKRERSIFKSDLKKFITAITSKTVWITSAIIENAKLELSIGLQSSRAFSAFVRLKRLTISSIISFILTNPLFKLINEVNMGVCNYSDDI